MNTAQQHDIDNTIVLHPDKEISESDKKIFLRNLVNIYEKEKKQTNVYFTFKKPPLIAIYSGYLQLSQKPYKGNENVIDSMNWKMFFKPGDEHKGVKSFQLFIADVLTKKEFVDIEKRKAMRKYAGLIKSRIDKLFAIKENPGKLIPFNIFVSSCDGHLNKNKRSFPCHTAWRTFQEKGIGYPSHNNVKEMNIQLCRHIVKIANIHMDIPEHVKTMKKAPLTYSSSDMYDKAQTLMNTRVWYNETYDERLKQTILVKNLYSQFEFRGLYPGTTTENLSFYLEPKDAIIQKYTKQNIRMSNMVASFSDDEDSDAEEISGEQIAKDEGYESQREQEEAENVDDTLKRELSTDDEADDERTKKVNNRKTI